MLCGCQNGPGKLTLYGVNTGKSDCLIFCLPKGKTLLVDTGLKDTYGQVKATLELAHVKKIDYLVLTHGHKDHIGGLKQLAQDYAIGTLYTNAYDTATYSEKERALLAEVSETWEQLRPAAEAEDGRGYTTILLGNIKMDFLAPARPYTDAEDDNNNSLVLRLTHGKVVFLLMGDATSLIEEDLLSWYGFGKNGEETLSADFLKAGHHGKADASTQLFIDAVSPKIVYIPGNRAEDPESPAQAVLQRYSAAHADVSINEGTHLAAFWISNGDSLSQGSYLVKD